MSSWVRVLGVFLFVRPGGVRPIHRGIYCASSVRVHQQPISSLIGGVDMQTFSESGISEAFTNVISLLTTGFNFLTSNPFFMVLLVAPLVFGILGGLLSVFRK